MSGELVKIQQKLKYLIHDWFTEELTVVSHYYYSTWLVKKILGWINQT